MSFQEGWIIKI